MSTLGLIGLAVTALFLFLFMLTLGFNLGVGQSAIHGASEACEMIRVQLIDCAALAAREGK